MTIFFTKSLQTSLVYARSTVVENDVVLIILVDLYPDCIQLFVFLRIVFSKRNTIILERQLDILVRAYLVGD